ncbi:MAG: energy transducer TonB [Terriglobales bacterium]
MFHSRVTRAVLSGLLWCSFPAPAGTGFVPQADLKKEVRQRYAGKLLLLSAPSRFDLIHFDAQGHPTREPTGEPWTTCGLVRARKINMRDRQMTIDGERVIVALDPEPPGTKLISVNVDREVHVTIELPPSIHNPTELSTFLAQVFSMEGLEHKIANAWRADVDLKALEDASMLPPDGRIGTLESGQAVYAWESGVVTKPKAFYKPLPTYAADALSKRVSGTIQVRVIVNEKGFPEILEVIQHLPEGLDARVLSAVSQWRFQPGLRDGVAAATLVIVEIKFHLRSAKREAGHSGR